MVALCPGEAYVRKWPKSCATRRDTGEPEQPGRIGAPRHRTLPSPSPSANPAGVLRKRLWKPRHSFATDASALSSPPPSFFRSSRSGAPPQSCSPIWDRPPFMSAGSYIVGLMNELLARGHVVARLPEGTTAALIAILVTGYFWWRNTRGIHESSDDALRIMQVTTVMVVIMIAWCSLTLMRRGG